MAVHITRAFLQTMMLCMKLANRASSGSNINFSRLIHQLRKIVQTYRLGSYVQISCPSLFLEFLKSTLIFCQRCKLEKIPAVPLNLRWPIVLNPAPQYCNFSASVEMRFHLLSWFKPSLFEWLLDSLETCLLTSRDIFGILRGTVSR